MYPIKETHFSIMFGNNNKIDLQLNLKLNVININETIDSHVYDLKSDKNMLAK